MLTICLSGPDGSGKTTQLSLLKKYLNSRGLKTYYLWLRWFSITSYLLYFYARVLKRTIIIRQHSGLAHVHIFWVDRVLKKLYPFTLLFDVLLWYYINRFIAWLKRVDVMLLDRGLLDVFVDLIWETRNTKFLHSPLARIALKHVEDMHVFILAVRPSIAIWRKREAISMKEIEFRLRCYEVFAKKLKLSVIDTTATSMSETFRIIMKHLVSKRF